VQLGSSNEPAVKQARLCALQGAAELARAQGEYTTADTVFTAGLAIARDLDDKVAMAHCLERLAFTVFQLGQRERARVLAEDAIALCRQVNDSWSLSWAIGTLALCAEIDGDYQRASALQNERLQPARDTQDAHILANVQTHLGILEYEQGQHEQATELLEAGRRGYEEAGENAGLAWTLSHCARAARIGGATSVALQRFGESAQLFQEIGVIWGVADCLEGIAGVQCDLGQFAVAARLMGSATTLRQTIGLPPAPRDQRRLREQVQAARTELGGIRFEALTRAGQVLTMNEAMAEALALLPK
jgi:tetratricopeptide (TPR) repeat protein